MTPSLGGGAQQTHPAGHTKDQSSLMWWVCQSNTVARKISGAQTADGIPACCCSPTAPPRCPPLAELLHPRPPTMPAWADAARVLASPSPATACSSSSCGIRPRAAVEPSRLFCKVGGSSPPPAVSYSLRGPVSRFMLWDRRRGAAGLLVARLASTKYRLSG
jgi:hypothetical protein